MRFIKRICIVATVLALTTLGVIQVTAKEVTHRYQITPESNDWFDYTVQEKTEMLRIDDTELEKMSDQQLVRAIADYPYLVDIYAYDSIGEGIEKLSENCDAFAELMSRNSGEKSMFKYGKQIVEKSEVNAFGEARGEFVSYAIDDILEYLEGNHALNDEYHLAKTGPKTPNGSSVSYSTNTEWHNNNYHKTLDNEVVSTYGVTLVRNGSCKYNCHSYAWYSTSSANSYWIDDPSIYMTDGSYSKKYSGRISTATNLCYISVNDRVYYGSGTHSALFIGSPSNGAPIATEKVRSKWGALGVFEHTVANVPSGYDTSSISVWHR